MTPLKEPALNRRRIPIPARAGFSLIELLVVIGLIAVLSTLLLIGIGKLQTNSRRQQTRLVFSNLQSMYAEWDLINRRHFASYIDTGLAGSVYVPCPENVSDACPIPNPFAIPAITADDSTPLNRYGQAVWQTRDIMAAMQLLPTNTAALGKISSGTLMTFPAYLDSKALPIIPSPYNTQFATSSAFSSSNSYKPAVDALTAKSASSQNTFATTSVVGQFTTQYFLFRSIRPNMSPSVPPPDSNYWLAAGTWTVQNASNAVVSPFSELTVPVFRDGWGNPIIFIPSGILGVAIPTPPDANLVKSGSTITGVVAGSGAMASGIGTTGGIQIQVKSPDGRPFWASAGPDGDFSLGDDNLYSFEK